MHCSKHSENIWFHIHSTPGRQIQIILTLHDSSMHKCHILFINTLVVDVWIVPIFHLLWAVLLWTYSCICFLCRHVFSSLGYILRNGIAGSHGNSTFNLLRNFPKWLNHFTFPPMEYEVFSFSTWSPTFLIICLFGYMMWYLIVILGCYWLMTIEHFFMCLLAIYVSSLERCVYNSFALF